MKEAKIAAGRWDEWLATMSIDRTHGLEIRQKLIGSPIERARIGLTSEAEILCGIAAETSKSFSKSRRRDTTRWRPTKYALWLYWSASTPLQN